MVEIKSLIEQIQHLVKHHEKLLKIIELEKNALSAADLIAIQSCSYQKEVELETIRIAESKRQQIVFSLENIWGLEAGSLKMSGLLAQLSDLGFSTESKTLGSEILRLVSVIEAISTLNIYNREMIEKSLSHVDQMRKNIICESNPHRDVYSQSGHKKIQGGVGTRLISKEA